MRHGRKDLDLCVGDGGAGGKRPLVDKYVQVRALWTATIRRGARILIKVIPHRVALCWINIGWKLDTALLPRWCVIKAVCWETEAQRRIKYHYGVSLFLVPSTPKCVSLILTASFTERGIGASRKWSVQLDRLGDTTLPFDKHFF